jgi:hypothetical protein
MGVQNDNQWWKTGNVSIATSGNMPVQHDLGTKDVAMIVWPSENLVANSKETDWTFRIFNWTNVIPLSFSLDCSSYNSKRDWPLTIARDDPYYCVSPYCKTPTNVQSDMYNYSFTSRIRRSSIGITDDSITRGGMCKGTYEWVAVDLNKALAKAPYAHGTITNSSSSTISIVHNLGTDAVAFYVFPTSTLTANGGYQRIFAGGMNLPGIFANVNIDISAYYTGSGPTTQTVSESATRNTIVACNLTPWSTQANWFDAESGQMRRSSVSFSNNSVGLTMNFPMGEYEWYAIDLSEIVTALGGRAL